jgi:hypothetical protein
MVSSARKPPVVTDRGTATAIAEWRAFDAVVARREALVLVIDDHAQAVPGEHDAALHL